MGSGSKIFIIAFLISALVFGLIGFAVVSAVANLTAPAADLDSLSEGAIVKTSSNLRGSSFNLLVINVDYRPELYSYDNAKVNALFGDKFGLGGTGRREEIEMLSAVLVRLDCEREEFTFTPIPATTRVGERSLSDIYLKNGISALSEQVRFLTGITVDKYAVITPAAAEKITDSLGGFEYSAISAFSAEDEVNVPSGNQTLTGKKVRTMMLCDYSGRSATRESAACELLRLFFEKLAESAEPSESCADVIKKLQTNIDENYISKNLGLIEAYSRFDKRELTLCGEYRDGSFIPDTDSTIDKFFKYRKYYG